LKPTDHGRPITDEELLAADFVGGYKYEIINGRVYVSAEPDPDENVLELWLYHKLYDYSRTCPGVINHVSTKTRVHVAVRRRATIPEPDVAAYSEFPLERRLRGLKWFEVSPVLVCEVLMGKAEKDLVRNVKLYLAVPSIQEYWVLDGREDAEKPSLIQHRRSGKRWIVKTLPFGSTLTTKLLPGFSLLIDPLK
jgi:Uma2 family endonuclease